MPQVSPPLSLVVEGCYERIELPRALAEAAGNSLTGECTLEKRTKANGVEPRARGFAYDWGEKHQTIFDHIWDGHRTKLKGTDEVVDLDVTHAVLTLAKSSALSSPEDVISAIIPIGEKETEVNISARKKVFVNLPWRPGWCYLLQPGAAIYSDRGDITCVVITAKIKTRLGRC
ncbi:hypothetical protein LY76DRAFT_590567 [Colletotrichum caudatum]|nr:hypothetical protein LY76DRAFT_590567 [Colletotrichum caudatum]